MLHIFVLFFFRIKYCNQKNGRSCVPNSLPRQQDRLITWTCRRHVGGVPRPDADKALPAKLLNVAAKYMNPQGSAHGAIAVTDHKQLETHPQQPTGSPEQQS